MSRTRLRGDRFFEQGRGSERTWMPVVEANVLFDEALARGQSEVTPDRQVSRTEASVPRLWPELRGQLDEPPELVSSTDSNSSREDEGAVEPHTCASVGAHFLARASHAPWFKSSCSPLG